MGLFGSAGKALGGLFGSGFGDRAMMAQAALSGDYGAMASMRYRQQQMGMEREKAEAEAQQRQAVQQGLKARGLSDSDINVLMANPDNASALVKEFLQPRQFGSGGGSIATPQQDGSMGVWTAPRFDDDGNIYAPGNGVTAPEVLQRGTKTVPVTAGGEVKVVDALSGGLLTGADVKARSGGMFGNTPPPTNGPQPGAVEDGYRFKGGNPADPNNWEEVGGAGPSAPRGFR